MTSVMGLHLLLAMPLPAEGEGGGLMSLQVNLMFWTLVIFGVLFFILRKYAYPAILSSVEAREKAATAIWVDLQLKSGAPPLEGQKFQAGESELEFRPCPATGAAPGAPEDEEPAPAQ